MSRLLATIFCMLLVFVLAPPAIAGGAAWRLVAEESSITYDASLNGQSAAAETIKTLSGTVRDNGAVEIHIDAQSAQSLVDVGNPKLVEYSFNLAQPTAVLRTQVDPAVVEGLAPGDSKTIPVAGLLVLSGVPMDVNTRLTVTRITPTRVRVTSNDRAVIDMDQLGASTGLTTLIQLAGLSGVKRTTNVAMHMVFDKTSAD